MSVTGWPVRPGRRCRQGWHRWTITHVQPTGALLVARDGSPVYDVRRQCARCPANTWETTTRLPRRGRA